MFAYETDHEDAFAVVLFLLLFPYFAMSFWQQKHEDASSENDSLQQEALELTAQLSEGSYFVYWEKEQKKIPSELFLVGALDRKSTRLNSSHSGESRMPSSA